MGATKASATAFLIPVVALMLGVVIRRRIGDDRLAGRRRVCLFGAAVIRDARILRVLLPRRLVRVGARV